MSRRSDLPLSHEDRERLKRAARGVETLRRAARAAEDEFAAELARVAPSMRRSACNLVHYLAVRRHDVRRLQEELACFGLSSLGRLEAHVMDSLDAVARALHALRRPRHAFEDSPAPPVRFEAGNRLLARHASAVLGPAASGLRTCIMVTMPGDAAQDASLIADLVEGGMGIMRVNCAHDSAVEWGAMVAHLRRARRETGKRCLVSFDLAGPKLRTGPIAGPAVAKWRPQRDPLGRVAAPARVRLVASSGPLDPAETAIRVDGAWLRHARAGDTVRLVDARGCKRRLRLVDVADGACTGEIDDTAYVVPGTRLTLARRGHALAHGRVLGVPPRAAWIELRAGDVLDLVRGEALGREAVRDPSGAVATPATVSCALPEVFSRARRGAPILFDDGRIRGVVRRVLPDRLRIGVTQVIGASAKLRGEKGINLPDSDLELSAFTAKDARDLSFAVRHGDLVAMSFVQRPEDVDALLAALARRHAKRLGIILKIETKAAFRNLPRLLLAAMRHPRLAVMVARGDLGVEVGFERLSEVQEEILWLCEAAHVPVIWATQVLESLAKGGMPSRAEVTDAAVGSRAECVMLNKGPYIRDTMRFLVDVLARMEKHQHKKTSRLRKLQVSRKERKPPARAAAAWSAYPAS